MHSLCEYYIQKSKILKAQNGEGDESNYENKEEQKSWIEEFEFPEDMSFNTSTAMTVAAHNNLEE